MRRSLRRNDSRPDAGRADAQRIPPAQEPKPPSIVNPFAVLKRRSSTVVRAEGGNPHFSQRTRKMGHHRSGWLSGARSKSTSKAADRSVRSTRAKAKASGRVARFHTSWEDGGGVQIPFVRLRAGSRSA